MAASPRTPLIKTVRPLALRRFNLARGKRAPSGGKFSRARPGNSARTWRILPDVSGARVVQAVRRAVEASVRDTCPENHASANRKVPSERRSRSGGSDGAI